MTASKMTPERRRHEALRDSSRLDADAERAGHVVRSLARRQAQLVAEHGPAIPAALDPAARVVEIDVTDQIAELARRGSLAGVR